MSEGTVNQEGNIVAGHQGGRDVNVTNNYYPPTSYQAMRRLVEKFEQEIKGDAKLQHFIEELERYYKQKHGDNLTLEEKLAGSAAKNFTDTALVAKESYSKLLTKYSLYQSAQEINVYLLGRTMFLFEYEIRPKLREGINESALATLIIDVERQLMSEVDDNPLRFTSMEVVGMLYFLTAKCHLNWKD
jgi:hypothetical protein